ncbi:hypothetical protein ALC53_08707 [Atta colombica]|uniref:Uncharacterized protein n=1 Tax=Atta colombica TaxID=520822 RepID=A0A151I2U0_9HYME|nr:hypothetical protein ALC53_08707 [Atta colombica]
MEGYLDKAIITAERLVFLTDAVSKEILGRLERRNPSLSTSALRLEGFCLERGNRDGENVVPGIQEFKLRTLDYKSFFGLASSSR